MKVKTSRLGEIGVNEKNIIVFPNGILGFSEYSKYIILPADENQETPFYYLQSIEDENLSFIILRTFSFFQTYDFELDESTVVELDIKESVDVQVFSIVTAKGNLKEATTNLKAPIIINNKTNHAKQVVLEKGDFLIKQPLFSINRNKEIQQDKKG
jgi:flagellar assembly factor FliW